ncbi:hypothetical protein ABZ442_30665 [Streptomyces triculaminicus]|uniref:hypothetical protein n=1 Tax=Streptomyces triculaminicus TaxID=2816232 RepID=UPI0033C4CB98
MAGGLAHEEALKFWGQLAAAHAELTVQTQMTGCRDDDEQHHLETTLDLVKQALETLHGLSALAKPSESPR